MAPLLKKAYFAKLLFVGFLVAGTLASHYFTTMAAENNRGELNEVKAEPVSKNAQEVTGPLKIDVVLKRHYLDGEISEETVYETIWSMEDFWSEYREWQLVDQQEGKLIFSQNIDDISPLLKADGYFGLSEEGILTIYRGMPSSDQVIQSFFQIDISKLESRQQEELKNGIPVMSKYHYQQVIESFKPLSMNEQ